MGSTFRQGSAALLHVQGRAWRLGIALVVALSLGLLGAAPAMAGNVSVVDGELRYGATGQANELTITESAGEFTVSDSAGVNPGTCTPVSGTSATCTGVSRIRVNVGDQNDTVVINAAVPSTIFGRDGDDSVTGGSGPDHVEGQAGQDTINVRGPGPDEVICTTGDQDTVTSDGDDTVSDACHNDNGVTPQASITDAPSSPTSDATPSFSFSANEGDVHFVCAVEPVGTETPDKFPCATPHTEPQPLDDGTYVFTVWAQDDVAEGPPASREFRIDRTAPQVIVTRLAPTDTSTAHFQLDAVDPSSVTFECRVEKDGGVVVNAQSCSSIFTTPPLADGEYVLFVTGTDAAGNATISDVGFRIEAVKGGGGVGPPTPPTVQPRRIIIDSLVLISGATVKMSRRGVVRINLHCAGVRQCKGRMTITTAEPVSRKRRKLERLGSTRFSIGANKKRKVRVRFSKSKRKLARRLKRFKAKVVITEIDQRGNRRISSRVFVLRAR